MQDAYPDMYSVCTKATRRKAAVHDASHSLSHGNLKNLVAIDPSHSCASFTAAVPSTIITYDQLLQNREYL